MKQTVDSTVPPEHFDLSPAQASRLLGVHRITVTRWAEQGVLPEWRTPGGHRRYRRSDVLALLSRRNAA